jgi:hypothetical protein
MGLKNKGGAICYIIGIRKNIQQKIHKNYGDKIINVKIKEMEK